MDNGKPIIDWKNGISALQRQYQQPAKTAVQKFIFWLVISIVAFGVGRWIGFPPIDEMGFTGIRILRTVITLIFGVIGMLSFAWALVKAWEAIKEIKG